MPNWCFSNIAFYPNPEVEEAGRKAVEDLKDHVNTASRDYNGEDNKGFGRGWLGSVLESYDMDPDEYYKYMRVSCAGNVISTRFTLDSVFGVKTVTAWEPLIDMWEVIISHNYTTNDGIPLIEYVYTSEEPNGDIFINTDTEGRFFNVRYRLLLLGDDLSERITIGAEEKKDPSVIDLNKDYEIYFSDNDDILGFVNTIFSTDFDDMYDFIDWVDCEEIPSVFIDKFLA